MREPFGNREGTLRNLGNLGNLERTLGTLSEPWEPLLGNLGTFTWEPGNLYLGTFTWNLGTLGEWGTFTIQPWEPWKTWEPSGNLEETLKEPWGYLLRTLREPWQSNLGNLLETFTMSPWEPGPRLLGNLYIIILGTLTTFTWKTWDPCREPWRNLEGTFWEPFANREGTLRNLGNLGNLERTLGTLGALSEPWEPWEPLLGNLGTFTWEPLLGNLYLEPGNLGGMGFGAAPVCSEIFTMAEDPKAFCCWGKREMLDARLFNNCKGSTPMIYDFEQPVIHICHALETAEIKTQTLVNTVTVCFWCDKAVSFSKTNAACTGLGCDVAMKFMGAKSRKMVSAAAWKKKDCCKGG